MNNIPNLVVTAQGFKLEDSEDLYKWYFNPALDILLAKPTKDKSMGSNNFVVKEPDYSKLLDSCHLNADKYDYAFEGIKTARGIEFKLDEPSKATINQDSAKINDFTALMME